MTDYVLVPRESTEAMTEAAMSCLPDRGCVFTFVDAAVDAAIAARPPVDYDALAVEIVAAEYGVSAEYATEYLPACVRSLATALPKVLP